MSNFSGAGIQYRGASLSPGNKLETSVIVVQIQRGNQILEVQYIKLQWIFFGKCVTPLIENIKWAQHYIAVSHPVNHQFLP